MIRIGGTELIAAAGCYVVAEIGSNWTKFEDCYDAVAIAKDCGADAVKFQAFTSKSLYGAQKKPKGYSDAYELPLDWLVKLKNRADQCGIHFMCTVFEPEMVRIVDPLCYAHKVASSEACYEELLREIAKMGKPVFLSTGAKTHVEISAALSWLKGVPVVPLYCVAAYPAKNVDLTLIDDLRDFADDVGFSDHSRDYVYLPYAAVHFHKACVLEKHLSTISADTPDSPHSLKPAEFRQMTARIRGRLRSLVGPSPEEQEMLLRHNRRLITTAEVKKGEKFRKGKNFGAYRCVNIDTKGLSPLHASAVDDHVATRALEAGEPIGHGDFD